MHPTAVFMFLAVLPLVTLAGTVGCGKQAPGYEPTIAYKAPRKLTRIIGGDYAKPHSWPWQVWLFIEKDDGAIEQCGSSLLRVYENVEQSDILVTAGHCVTTETSRVTMNPIRYRTDQIKAYPGVHNNLDAARSGQFHELAEIQTHPEYHETAYNDIALIKLAKPVNFSDTVRPICVPAQDEAMPIGQTCAMYGWGRHDKYSADVPQELKQLAVPLLDADTCKSNKNGGWGDVFEESQMICAGSLDGDTGGCHGDSGGGLACQIGEEGRYTLYGVGSFVDAENGNTECVSKGRPTGFARVTSYMTWINEEMKNMTSLKLSYQLNLEDVFSAVRPKPYAEPPRVLYKDPPTA